MRPTAAAGRDFDVVTAYVAMDIFHNFRHTIPNIKIDGIDVEQVDHAKLLGVTISQDLSWNKHVENIVKKAGKRLYMMYQLKRAGISQSDLVTACLPQRCQTRTGICLSCVAHELTTIPVRQHRNDTEKSIKMYFPRCKLC